MLSRQLSTLVGEKLASCTMQFCVRSKLPDPPALNIIFATQQQGLCSTGAAAAMPCRRGPGCSSVGSAFIGENGPFYPVPGSTRKLMRNHYRCCCAAAAAAVALFRFAAASLNGSSAARCRGPGAVCPPRARLCCTCTHLAFRWARTSPVPMQQASFAPATPTPPYSKPWTRVPLLPLHAACIALPM